MNNGKMVAVIGLGAILPDAFDIASFWNNVVANKYSVTDIPAGRWNVDLYYDPDPSAVDKTYSKIGAFVRDYQFDPLKNGIAIPPKVLSVMDVAQQWALAASQQALLDYGYPERKLDPDRVAVIFGNANAGEMHYRSTFRILLPEYLDALTLLPEYKKLPSDVQISLVKGVTEKIHSKIPVITEDTMPGELSNIISGRVANVFNFSGPNFVTDAACASSLAAIQSACEGLLSNKFDTALSGGIDRNMGPESYIKFSKIGALSADGSRPYADGANGFVMGEGAVVLLLKRLEDAERNGDKIYAVIRGIGGSSDGKGKGITAPNPLGQQRAIERAWLDAQIDPRSVGLIEGHGTSTKVGDVAEVGSMNAVFGSLGLKNGSVALGSVKSNIGHLKSAAGAVGLLKTILALHHRMVPPSANFTKPNPRIDFANLPFKVNSQPQEWSVREGNFRFAGVSSFGFGGTNFHVVLEEYFPGVIENQTHACTVPLALQPSEIQSQSPADSSSPDINKGTSMKTTHLSNTDSDRIKEYVLATVSEKTGYPAEMLDMDLDLEADLGIDTVKQAELFATIRTNYGIPRREDLHLSEYNTLSKVVGFVHDAMDSGNGDRNPHAVEQDMGAQVNTPDPGLSTLQLGGLVPYQGLFFASANSPSGLKTALEQELDQIKKGQVPSSHCPSGEELACQERIAIDYNSPQELSARLEKALNAFESGNPGIWKALQAYGVHRGSGKPGKVAFLFPGQGSQYVNMLLDLRDTEPVVKDTFDEADRVMSPILGRPLTSFIYAQGGEETIEQAEVELKNTAITQPAMLTANVAILRILRKYGVEPDLVVGHSLGEYAALVAAGVLSFAEALEVVSARGREMTKIKVEDPGCMAAVSAPLEKVEEVIRSVDDYIVIANINSPVQCVLGGTTKAINTVIEKFQAEGIQAVKIPVSHAFHTKIVAPASAPLREVLARMNLRQPVIPIVANVTGELYPTGKEEILDLLASQVASPVQFVKGMQTLYAEGARIFIEVGPKRVLNALAADNLKDKADVTILATNHPRKGGKASFNEALCGIYAAGIPTPRQNGKLAVVNTPSVNTISQKEPAGFDATSRDDQLVNGSVVITGAGLGLPGKDRHVFDDGNIESILNGEMRIGQLSEDARRSMLEKHVTRLVKSDAGAVMEEITDLDQVLKLAGQGGEFDLVEEFGVPAERVESLDTSTQLAIGAGLEALRDAGIPLVLHHRRTTKGTHLPDRWKLPESMQDETGVIFCSAFPGLNRMAEEADHYYESRMLERQLVEIRNTLDLVTTLAPTGLSQLENDLQRRIFELEQKLMQLDYHFDRRFIFRVLPMGHSQFAEYIGARGPNTHVNAACSTTTHALSIAEDWIRQGRCRRVVVIAGDDITSPNLISWIGTSLFASGAATTEGDVRMAALPFDKRRNGMIMGMGAAALVVETEDAARERGVRAIGEILASHIANSAFHGTRLDVEHVSKVMDRLLATAEKNFGIQREQIAAETVFVSHETYTPARGGSASAEIHALRSCFGDQANRVVIANTKGFTGHTMGVGIEDVVAVKALETGIIPPIAHIQDGFIPDPELGDLNLSKGGVYHPQYFLRLGAGFGSQIAMTLVHKIPGTGERIDRGLHDLWLNAASGYEHAELEITKRTLRIKSQGVPSREPARSTWSYGQIPHTRSPFGSHQVASPGVSHETDKQPQNAQIEVKPESREQRPILHVELAGTGWESSTGREEVKNYVLSVVSEKTGYPVEMLDLDLDLEADLGIDTVKQAELFATIRTHYGIARREDLILADYNNLAKVIDFMRESGEGIAESSATLPGEIAVGSVTPPEADPLATHLVETGTENDAIKEYVLSAVSEKTGYPQEMLDLELDLEADLGIDTVKQAELFATIRTHYGIARREDLILADYNTLSKVILFMQEAIGATGQPAVEPALVVKEGAAFPRIGNQEDKPLSKVSEHKEAPGNVTRRIPIPVLLPRYELCQPTGIDLDKSRIVIVGDKGKVAQALARKLKSAKAEILQVTSAEAGEKISLWGKDGRITGLYFLPALDSDPQLDPAQDKPWSKALSERLDGLFDIARKLPADSFLIAATRMGGFHGFINTENPLGGAVSGFLKSLRRERANQLIKVIDFDQKATPSHISDTLVLETLNDPVNVEIGHEKNLRFGVALRDEPSTTEGPEALRQGSVFVVSGGTGGITGSVVKDLAGATRGTFYLMGRAPFLKADNPDLVKIKQDPKALRTELQTRLASDGVKVTPVLLEKKISALERYAATLDVIKAVENSGGKAVYVQCDVTDPDAVNKVIQTIAAAEPRVDVFIHAAGVEKSHKIESKTIEEYQQITSVKALGFVNIISALEKFKRMPDKMVFFSSVAGRFGNAGQTDYSAANDLLSKYALWLPRKYPQIQAISIDWGAWAEVGMASRGNIPGLMERAGIEMLKPAAAAPAVRAELNRGTCGEVVLAGSLGALESCNAANGGMDVEKGDLALRAGTPIHKMLSHLVAFDVNNGITLEAELNPVELSYLRDHAINGIPVLPGVIGIEGFSVASKHIASVLGTNEKGFEIERLENIKFLAPFKFYDNKPRVATWHAVCYRKPEGLVVKVTLESDMKRRNGSVNHILHFEGLVYLTQNHPVREAVALPPQWGREKTVTADEIYRLYFHGPSFQVLEAAQRSENTILGRLNKSRIRISADDPELFATPMLIELCFQTAGLWEAGATGILALPLSIGKLQLYQRPVNGVPVYAEVKPRRYEQQISFDAKVVDANGNVFLELTNYQTSPLPYPAVKELIEPMRVLVSDTNGQR